MADAAQKIVDELIRLYEPERAEVAGLPEELNAENLDAWAPFVMERTARTRQLLSQLRIALEAAQRPSVNLPTIPGVYAGQRKTRWELDTNGAWWFRGYEGGAHPTPEQQDRRPSDVLDYGMPLILLAQRPPVNSVVEAIDAARDSIARGELASVVIDTDDYPQRPPVDPEVRDEVAEALLRVGGPRGGNGPDTNLAVVGYDDEQIAYIVSEGKRRGHREWDRVLWQADAILARFSVPSQPVYDEEKIARWLYETTYSISADVEWEDQDDEYRGVICEVAAALVAALRGGELTREETNE